MLPFDVKRGNLFKMGTGLKNVYKTKGNRKQ